MAPLRISFLIKAVNDLLPSNANLVRWGKKDDPTCPLCQEPNSFRVKSRAEVLVNRLGFGFTLFDLLDPLGPDVDVKEL
ncbi:reverse transcriptase [Plakobranchus ocellatus]|uniref:Reverse transcriptase n=1 Tax=Plakobranchus ocellatus TaxID=259542 RepID=A0AAV3YVN3_9GAST|nr:reverse transcriptase [Plakobranchus ocellatus]